MILVNDEIILHRVHTLAQMKEKQSVDPGRYCFTNLLMKTRQ